VSLSSYCQYPITKVINGDTVVVMTVKQGQDINKQFSILKDSIKSNIITIENSKKELFRVNKTFNDSLFSLNKNINSLNEQNVILKEEYLRVKKQIWSDRRERRFTAVGFAFVVLGWSTFFVLSK